MYIYIYIYTYIHISHKSRHNMPEIACVTSRCVRVILALGPCKYFLHLSNVNG